MVINDTNYIYSMIAMDIDDDPLLFTATDKPTGLELNQSTGQIKWTPDTLGSFPVTVQVSDGLGGTDSQSWNIEVIDGNSTDVPPDPSAAAPPLDEGESTVIGPSTEFLYTGPEPIQTGVAAETIDPVMAAVLRGRVTERDGNRLSGVTVSILGMPEYGQTLTRFDGEFDLVVNGGGAFTVNYEKDGYLMVQREIGTQWQQWAWLPDIVMIPLDPAVTEVDLTSPGMQVVVGSSESDADGTRQAVLLVPAGTTANMLMPNDDLVPISTLNIRATEYTVGDNGPETMPGNLPPTSGYTYAVELSADEAIAAGAVEVQFSQFLPFYLDNFIGFPVGGIVPTGSYNQQTGEWVAAANGRVIEVVSINSGLAELDVDGDQIADSGAALTALGISDAEREALGGIYSPGESLWRVPINHFSPWDHNWPFSPPADAEFPPKDPNKPDPDKGCNGRGSIIDCHNQSLRERLALTGSAFSLNYWSTLPGSRSIEIPLTSSNPLIQTAWAWVELEVQVAGREIELLFSPTPNLKYKFEWDGLDSFGRKVQGQSEAKININNVYKGSYNAPADATWAFGRTSVGGSLDITGDRDASTVSLGTSWTRLLGGLDLRTSHGLGGWSLSVHHFYDPVSRTLYLGSGEKRSSGGSLTDTVVTTVVGSAPGEVQGTIFDIEIEPDGNLLFAELNQINRIDSDGVITVVAGTGVSGYNEDEIPATEAMLNNVRGIDLAPDGSLYIADRGNNRIRKVGPDGMITTVAGDGFNFFNPGADDVPATETQAVLPDDVIASPDGSFYFTEAFSCRVRRVDTNGIVSTVAGGDTNCSSQDGDGGPATLAGIQAIRSIALGPDGKLFIVSDRSIRVVGNDGIINTVVGGGLNSRDDGEPAVGASFPINNIFGLAFDDEGTVYFGAGASVRRVGTDGILGTLAGTGIRGMLDDGEGGPARAALLGYVFALARGARGQFFAAESPLLESSYVVRRFGSPVPGFSATDILIASEDGTMLYQFSQAGRHIKTINTLTSATMYSFEYDSGGRLVEVRDGDSNVTAIGRDVNGKPLAIIAPGGQTTTLNINPQGYLQSVTNPALEQTSMTYTSDGQLKTFTDPVGNVSTMTYDEDDRLIVNDDGNGGIQTFSRVDGLAQYTVTRTTAMGKVSTYLMKYLGNGRTESTVTNPDGDQVTVRENADGSSTTTMSDGTTIQQKFGPDPRFGMQSPILESMLVKTPGNPILSNDVTQSRDAVLTDPTNPLSLESLEDTITVNGRVYTDDYDALTKTLTKTSPEGQQVVSLLDSLGMVTSTTHAIGLDPRLYTYDVQGRLEQSSHGSESLSYGYDSSDRVISRTNAATHVTGYEYDDADRVNKMTKADGQVLNYQYDANGRRTSLQMPSTDTHSMTWTRNDLRTGYTSPGNTLDARAYDADRDLLSRTLPGGRTITNNFDGNRRWTGMDYSEAGVLYDYDSTRDRITTMTRTPVAIGDTQAIDYLYNGSLITRATWSGASNGTYSYFYDANFFYTLIRLQTSGDTQLNSTVTWNDDGQQTGFGPFTLTRGGPGGALSQVSDTELTHDLQYDSLGRIEARTVEVNALPAYDYTVTYNNIGQVSEKDETVNGVNHVYVYSYDAIGRLTNVTRDTVQIEAYTYDDNDNRLSTLTASSTYDIQDRLTEHDGITYSLNTDGFLASRGSDTFNYSARGELISVGLPGPVTITYSYDGMGRQVARTDADGTTQYLYGHPRNPMLLTAVKYSSGDRTIYYHDPATGYYAMQRAGVSYYIATDQIGSPRVVTDAAGVVVKEIEYDSFGKRLTDTNPAFELHIGYAGGLEDTATGMVRFGYRDYDQDAGRWTARDPILYDGGQANLYAYSGNNPVNQRDPTGLWCVGGSAYVGFGGGAELCCKGGECSLCAEGGVGKGGGGEAGEGEPKEEGTRPFLEGGVDCGPLSAGFKCEAGGKCGPSCDAEGGLGPFKISTSGDKSGSGGGGGSDSGDSGSGVKGKCSAGGKAGVRGCGRF